MKQVSNPLREKSPLDVEVTAHARYQMNQHGLSVREVWSILNGSNSVWSDTKPDGRTQHISRAFDDRRGEINLVWQIENDQRILILNALIGELTF